MVRRHARNWLVSGLVATMPALCLGQATSASSTSEPSSGASDGFKPFGAVKNFFDRVLPAQRAPSAPAPTPVPAPDAPAAPAAPLAVPFDVAPAPAAASAPAALAPADTPVVVPSAAAAVLTNPLRQGIVLILPGKAPAFSRAAEVTRAGFMAAREAAKEKLDVTMIETDGTAEGARSAYRDGSARALVVVGPLTRTEVGALVGETMLVPTLVLNLPEAPANAPLAAPRLPTRMSALALNIELEARSAARAVYSADTRTAVVVTTNSVLQKRAAAAFTEAWINLGGNIGEAVEFSGSLARVRQGVDKAKSEIVFLAADAQNARLLRPYLGRNTTVIATSQVYAGAPKSEAQKFYDMKGIRFIDMPWLHQSERSAAHGIARPEAPLSADLERLYALGIDAYRIAQELARGRADFDLDGVTGRLHVHAGLIEREPIQAEYRDGEAVAEP